MDKIKWCTGIKGGLSLIEPNSNLSEAYIKKSEEALESMRINIFRDWKISTAYYTIYFSLYAILMKLGVKCEIHSCTIEFVKRFLNEFFGEDEIDFVEDSLKARIDAQYYINKLIPDKRYERIIQGASEFLVKCKFVISKINEKKILEIRERFSKENKRDGEKND